MGQPDAWYLISEDEMTEHRNPMSLLKTCLKFGTYSIRCLKRFGRQRELSYLLKHHNFDIIGIQETKCSGNCTAANKWILIQ